MIKRICKTKQSKHGAILVVVVLILALAMIFIASAMMLTQSTRTRLYERTMQSQARLTVTAASEVFLEALQTQEITDDQVDALLAASHEKHENNKDKMKMVVDGVPGMSTDDDNCTYLDLYYKEDATDTVCADFTTVIGDEIENVQVVLVIQEPDGESFEIFNNQIDIGASVSNNNLRFTQGVGMYNKDVTPSNNNIFIRGSSANQTNDSIFFSNVIYTGEVYSFWGGKGYFMGDIIFKDKSYLTTKDSGPVIKGDIFFFNKSDNGCFRFHQEGGWDSIMNSSSTRIVINDNLDPQGPDCTQSIPVDKWSSYTPGKDNNQKIKDLLEKRPVYFVDNKNKTVSAKNVKGTYQVKNAAVDQANGTYKGLPDDLASKNTKYKNSKISSFPSSCDEVFVTINPITNNANKGIKTVSKSLSKFTRTEYEAVTDSKGDIVSYKVHPKGSDVGEEDVKVYEFPLTTKFPGKNYFIDGDGKAPDAAGGADYTAKYYELYDKNGNLRADHKITLSKAGFDAIDGKTITVSNTNAGTVNTKVDKDGTANGVIDLKPGWYQFYPGTLDNNTTPYIIAIDGSRADEYRLYFSKGTYWFKSLIIAVYNVTDAKSVFCILEPETSISLSCCNNRDCGKALCIAGFLSVKRDECGTASALAKYIKGGCNGRMGGHLTGGPDGECQSWQRPDGTNYVYYKDGVEKGDIKYSKYYDSIRKPSMFIFGQGINFRANSGSVLEAYCGLYKDPDTKTLSVFGGTEGHLDGSFPCYIYGRVECNTFDCGNSQECYCMPYCPQPGGSTTQDPQRRAVTKYKVSNIIYYYKKDKAGS